MLGFTGLAGFILILGAAGGADRNSVSVTVWTMVFGAILMTAAELGARYVKYFKKCRRKVKRYAGYAVRKTTAVRYRNSVPHKNMPKKMPAKRPLHATVRA